MPSLVQNSGVKRSHCSSLTAGRATMAPTNKCLAQSNKSYTGGKATKERERLSALVSSSGSRLVTTAMKTRLALALFAAIATAVPASGAADRSAPWGEPRSRQPYDPGRVPPEFRAPPPAAPHPRHVPDVQPPPYGSPGSLVPLPLPYQRPWTN
jgi:hypothetical protein